MKNINWKQQKSYHQKELSRNRKNFYQKRETKQIRILLKQHKILKSEAGEYNITMSKLLENILKSYFRGDIIKPPNIKR